MQVASGTLLPEIRDEPAPTFPDLKQWDLDKLLPIELIRQHTKTDDVPRVTDTQLRFYRKASIEEAEAYTGLILAEQRQIIEAVKQPARQLRAMRRGYFIHRTDHPIADGIAYVYGQSRYQGSTMLTAEPGAREVRIPLDVCGLDLTSSCCDPCGSRGDMNVRLMYRAGFRCEDDIPAGIILGCLKFIAWSISNPGDEVVTVRNRESGGESGIIGTNNAAWASGAIEQWRIYVKDAI